MRETLDTASALLKDVQTMLNTERWSEGLKAIERARALAEPHSRDRRAARILAGCAASKTYIEVARELLGTGR